VQAVPAYRADIDGLRALAVAAVILFHADVPGFGGGYVGVDVFFVISGYLITQLLAGSARQPLGTHLKDFYLRRARRILPALLATCLIVAAAAAAFVLPWDLENIGKYLAATSAQSTNIAAWVEGLGYFQSKLPRNPLTHFWSIAIEEQFYILYPITLVLIGRYLPRYRTGALLGLGLLSFAVCVWGSYHAPAANYFLAPSRGWELLLGASLATSAPRPLKSALANEVLAALALAALAAAVCLYGPATRFPGAYALVPCGAAALLIHTGRHGPTWIRRFLSLRPLVFTGLISYSLYLAHFPVLTLFGYYNIVAVGPAELGLLVALIYLIAMLSFRWVETPIRARAVLRSARGFVAAALTVNLLVLLTGATLWLSHGLPRRFPPEMRVRGGEWLFDSDYITKCSYIPLAEVAAGGLCSFGPQRADAPRALVWGDSHAMALLPAYEKLAKAHQIRLYFAVHSSCRPLLGVTNRSMNDAQRVGCGEFNAAVAQAVRRLDPRVLILNAHWIDADADLIPRSDAGAEAGESNFSRGLRGTLQETGSDDRSVCVVLDVPTYPYDMPSAVGVARKRGMSEDFLKLTRAQALDQYRGPERDVRALEQRGVLRSADPKDLLCPADACSYEAGGQLLYWDSDHLSWTGAQYVAGAIDGCFQDLLRMTTRK